MRRLILSGLALLAQATGALFAQGAATPAKPMASAPAATTATPPREPGLYATIQTSMGDMSLRLFEKESPITVKNFVDLALGRKEWTHPRTGVKSRKPLYAGTTFHRVLPDFMIQGGDPLGTGTGGTEPIPDEFDPSLRFDIPGRLAMANAGPGTGSSQFFITEKPTTWLNGKHTIFGQLLAGQEVVNRIANVPRNPDDNKPLTPVVIRRIAFQRVGPGAPVGGPAGARPAAAKPGVTRPKPAATKPKPTPAKPKPAPPKP